MQFSRLSADSQMNTQEESGNEEEELTKLGLGLSGQKRGQNDRKYGKDKEEGPSGQKATKRAKKDTN